MSADVGSDVGEGDVQFQLMLRQLLPLLGDRLLEGTQILIRLLLADVVADETLPAGQIFIFRRGLLRLRFLWLLGLYGLKMLLIEFFSDNFLHFLLLFLGLLLLLLGLHLHMYLFLDLFTLLLNFPFLLLDGLSLVFPFLLGLLVLCFLELG